MALVPCKECKKEVSTSAATCPHCGVKSPAVGPKQTIAGIAVMAVAALIVYSCVSGGTEKKVTETPEQIAARQAACKTDLSCWGEENLAAGGAYCQPYVERLAKYSHKWTDSTLELKFYKYRWADKSKGTVTYIGDRIQFQNGFGAFQNHVYECDFDPATNRVLNVRAEPGRLSQ